MTPLALLAEEVGVNERTLRRAVGQGTLRGTRPTPRKLDLPSSERQYVRRWWGLLSRLRTALRTEHNVRFALLFGSAARGTDEPGSDLDVLVDLRDASLERVVDLATALTERIGRPVDVVRLRDAEADPAFLAELLADGRVLVDRDGLWPRLRQRESDARRRGRRRDDRRAHAALEGIDRLLQNYVAELAEAGVRLAGLPPGDVRGSAARRAFEALRDADVIGGALCRRLVQAQGARARIEHGYVETSAGDVHQAAELVHASALEFIAAYRRWIAPFVEADA